jgi:hypothetical protein
MSQYQKLQFKLRRIPEIIGFAIGLVAFIFSPRSDVHQQDTHPDGMTLFSVAEADVPSCGGDGSGGNDACGCAGGCASDSSDSGGAGSDSGDGGGDADGG